jgi:hypothetical protein
MKAPFGAMLVGIALMLIPIALVSVPAAAVVETRAAEPAAHPNPAWADCSIRLDCLQ